MSSATLQAADGAKLGAYVASPPAPAKAGLVVIQEIFGVNAHIRRVADDYAAQGYAVVAPAMFDRREAGVELDYTPEGIAKGRALKADSPWDEAALDVDAAVAHAKAACDGGPVGIVGYCWGGSVAWLAACRSDVAAAIGYYGGQIHEELRDQKPKCPVMLHFGDKDAQIPLDHVEAIGMAHPDVTIHVHAADHGFNCDARGSYEPESARLARERSLAFLAEHLR